jgi:hypothetical protein
VGLGWGHSFFGFICFICRFLFETTSNLRILHTGDFRLTLDDLKSLTALHFDEGTIRKQKLLDHLYVDTTFCTKNASRFPCRKEVIQRAIHHVREWMKGSPSNWIFIKFAGKVSRQS